MSTINPVLGYYFFLSKDKGLSNPKALLLIKYYTRLHGELTITPIVTVEEREKQKKEFNAFRKWCRKYHTLDLLEFIDEQLKYEIEYELDSISAEIYNYDF